MCKRIVGLDPIVFEDSKILIVGSMPSAISLKEQMYYANKNNRFWKILKEIFQTEDKIELLKVSHIALWDICHSCIRKTSADSEIKDIEPNDIQGLLDRRVLKRSFVMEGQVRIQCRNIFRILKRYIVLRLRVPMHSFR